MESAALTQCPDRIRESMMHVVEKHFIPTMLSSMDSGHDVVDNGIRAGWVLTQEVLPRVRMVEVCDEHPRCRETTSCEETDCEKECQTVVENEVAEEKDDEPMDGDKGVVLDSARKPFLVEFFVALASCTLVWKVVVPFHREKASRVVEAKEVDDGHQHSSNDQAERVDREWFLSIDPCPFQKGVLELLRVPTKFALCQQVISACMVAVVLENKLFPR